MHILNTVRKRTEWQIYSGVWKGQFYWHSLSKLWVNFVEEKRPNFKTSYLFFYCVFKVISNTGLKSRICSESLQNFIFVQWELVRDEAVKWSNLFCTKKQKQKVVPRHVYQHVRIKVALNSVSFHGKVTNQNGAQLKYSLIENWQFSFMQHLKNVCGLSDIFIHS